jgi:glutaredoxin-like protein NrdH
MDIRPIAKNVPGAKKRNVLMFALSTCGWCKKTKKLLSSLGMEYDYIDVDLLEGSDKNRVMKEFAKWNPGQSFPTLVFDNKHCVIGYEENRIKELCE